MRQQKIATRVFSRPASCLTQFAFTAAFAMSSVVARAEPPVSDAAETSASSEPNRAECLQAHQSAQELKRTGKLIEAQGALSTCSSATCPGAVISDCGQWIADLEQATPSMVFEVRLDQKEAQGAKLYVNGELVIEWSKALKVNPGRHVVRAELPSFEPIERNVVLPEGQRMRLIVIDFESPQAPALPETSAPALPPEPLFVERTRPIPVLVYPLLGIGLAGLASFGAFSWIGKSQQRELETTCMPACTDTELKTMKRSYLIGDVSAGIGAATLVGAAVVYFTRPAKTVESQPGLSLGIGPGFATSDGRSLLLSAERTW